MSKPSRRYLQMVRCRAYGHAWEDRGWLAMIAPGGVRLWDQELTCPRCGGTRHDRRSHGSLRVVSRVYESWEDYPGTLRQRDALAILVEHDAAQQEVSA
jgi:hypothetical protein